MGRGPTTAAGLAAVLALVATTAATGRQAVPPDLAARARTFVAHEAAGEWAAVRGMGDARLAALPDARLKEPWTSVVDRAGALVREEEAVRTESIAGATVYVVTCRFARGTVEFSLGFDTDSRVSQTSARPVGDFPPAYSVAAAFTERRVTVGGGDWPLPGTLLRPVGAGPFPGVVLVHDAGPHDQDESEDGRKPFRDLAEGLASQRIAVLRYEKRTREYWDRFVRLPGATVKDETIDDVVDAVGLLRQVPGVDPQEVFVLGHGLGGMLVPRIAAADSRIAGFVIMAASTGSIAETMLAQMRRAAGADGVVSSVERSDLAAMTAAVGRIHGLTAADAANPMLIVGAPASYWLDLRGYDPPAEARAVDRPLLVLQGEQDQQATMEDFGRWKAALSGRPDVTFRTYPVDHEFIDAPPASLASGGPYVAAGVVHFIAFWVSTTTTAQRAARTDAR